MTDGQGLFLLVTPKGALHWRFRYRFAGKRETVALGTYPVVTLDWARSRHQSFRNLLAHGIDPSALRAAPRKAPLRRNDADVGGGTRSHARRPLFLPCVRREQPQYSQSMKRHPELRTISFAISTAPFISATTSGGASAGWGSTASCHQKYRRK